jgi:hypothetical protein
MLEFKYVEPINNVANTKLRKKILAYSAIKIKANPSLPYSTLNPETSSDSPSAKSKGVRFVSAIQDTSQIIIIGINSITLFQYELSSISCLSIILPDNPK